MQDVDTGREDIYEPYIWWRDAHSLRRSEQSNWTRHWNTRLIPQHISSATQLEEEELSLTSDSSKLYETSYTTISLLFKKFFSCLFLSNQVRSHTVVTSYSPIQLDIGIV